MIALPTLETARLQLRRFELADAPAVQQLLNDPEVTGTLMDKTLPYSVDDAHALISASHKNFESGRSYVFAVVRKLNDDLVGHGDIEVRPDHKRGEIAYWIGRPYWWQGYATEAAKCLVQFGFEQLELNRIFAFVIKRNEASANVLQKAGLVYEGTQRHGALKDGVFEDVDYYGLLRQDYTG